MAGGDAAGTGARAGGGTCGGDAPTTPDAPGFGVAFDAGADAGAPFFLCPVTSATETGGNETVGVEAVGAGTVRTEAVAAETVAASAGATETGVTSTAGVGAGAIARGAAEGAALAGAETTAAPAPTGELVARRRPDELVAVMPCAHAVGETAHTTKENAATSSTQILVT